MLASSSAGLKPGALFASRFKVDEPLPGDWARPAFLGVDEQTGARVVLFELSAEEADQLTLAKQVSHQHLAGVVEVHRPPDEAPVLIAEHVGGLRLDERLSGVGKKSSVDAVRSALRIADAVSALHAAGSAHGALSPPAVVVEPAGHPAPAVTFVPPVRDPGPYRSPERAEGTPPSEADDAWAVAVLLHRMLTGELPPATGVGSVDDLVAGGVTDEALQEALRHGLATDAAQRSTDLRPLKRELARWFVEHAGEDAPASLHHSKPPPLPAGSTPPASLSSMPSQGHVPAVASSTPPQKKTPRRFIAILAGGAIVIGLAAAWGIAAVRSKPRVEVVEVEASAKPGGATLPKGEIALSEVPVSGESEQVTGSKMASCVAGYLPKGAFPKSPDVDWMCKEKDPREGGSKLRTAVVSGGATAAGGPTDAMKLFARLGWFEMAAFAAVRAGCCEEAESVALPEPSKGCGRMDEALQTLGRTVVSGQSHEAPLKAYNEAIECELKANRAPLYRRAGKPQGGEQAAFEELVKVIQTP